MAGKESLCICLDGTANMRRGESLHEALNAIQMLVVNKIFNSKQDVVGIVVHGTHGTQHGVAEDEESEEGQYPHITEVQKMAPVSCKTLSALLQVPALQPHSADFVDSLCVGIFAVLRHARNLKFLKRVLIITDGTSRCAVDDDQLHQIAQQLKDKDLKLEVLGVGFDPQHVDAYEEEAGDEDPDVDDEEGSDDDDGEGGVGNGDGSSVRVMSDRLIAARRARTCAMLTALSEDLGKERYGFTRLSDAVSMIEALQKRSVRSVPTFRGALAIGSSLGVPVYTYKKVIEAKPPSLKTVSKAGLESLEAGADPSNTVRTERRYYLQSAPETDIAPNFTVPGYRFGKGASIPLASALVISRPPPPRHPVT